MAVLIRQRLVPDRRPRQQGSLYWGAYRLSAPTPIYFLEQHVTKFTNAPLNVLTLAEDRIRRWGYFISAKMSMDEVEFEDGVDTPEIWENLSEWDNLDNPLAPLSDVQEKSILDLTAFCGNKFSAPSVSIKQVQKFWFIHQLKLE